MPNSRDVKEPVVKIDGSVRKELHCRLVERSVGGQRLDQAIVSVNLAAVADKPGGVGDLLQGDKWKREYLNKQLTVERTIEGTSRLETIHWGKVTEINPRLSSQSGPELLLNSKIEPYHFGQPLPGMYVRVKRRGQLGAAIETLYLSEDATFNPVIDGERVGNMSRHRLPGNYPHGRYFLDVESSRTPQALAERDEYGRTHWTLAHAALHLMSVCNDQEQYIENWRGSEQDLEHLFDDIELYGFTLPMGKYLPELLDMLLEPHGYTWYVEHHSTTRRRIAFGRLADRAALPIAVGHQKPGEAVDAAKTNTEELDLHYDVAKNLVNVVAAYGDWEYIELAAELVKTWPEKYDDLSIDDLIIGSAAWEANPAYHDVWRKWALNEAGDYVGVRPEIRTPFDFGTLFSSAKAPASHLGRIVPFAGRRGRFWPCITTNRDGTPIGPYEGIRIQWHNTKEWVDWPAGDSWGVLDRECGIVWHGVEPPSELKALGSQARIRVVGTVRSDKRILEYSTLGNVANSVNGDEVEAYIQAGDRFQLRWVSPLSPHYAQLYKPPQPAPGVPLKPPAIKEGELTHTSVDDRKRLREHAQRIAESWDRADCSGPIVLTGTDAKEIELCNCVPAIGGRGIDLRLAKSAERVPIVLGIRYDFQEQSITLQLDTVREEIPIL